MRAKIKALAFVTIAALIPTAAQAASTLDQQYNTADLDLGIGLEGSGLGQSFTVGRDGLLDRVELDLGRRNPQNGPSTLTMEIREITDGEIGEVLRVVTLASTDVAVAFGFVSFDFLDLDVDIGDVFVINLSADQDNGNDVFWRTDTGVNNDPAGTYDGGTAFVAIDFPLPEADRGFRTFVDDDIAAVPEPGTLALFGAALFGIALRRRRTRD
jgi:hypothetical protein